MASANITVHPSELVKFDHHGHSLGGDPSLAALRQSIIDKDWQYLIADFGDATLCISGVRSELVDFTKQLAAYAIIAFGDLKPWSDVDVDVVTDLDDEPIDLVPTQKARRALDQASPVVLAAEAAGLGS